MNTDEFKTILGDFHFDKDGTPLAVHIGIYQVQNDKWKLLYQTNTSATQLVEAAQ